VLFGRKAIDRSLGLGHLFSMSIPLVIIAVLICLPLLRYVGFYLSNKRTRELRDIRTRCGENFRASFFRAYCTAVFSEALVVLMLPFSRLLKSSNPGGGTPVIFVHGLYHNTSAWIFFRIFLARAGHGNFHFYGYNSFTRPFAPAAEGLAEFMDKVLADNPGQKVALIGHSLGGLVCRRAVAEPRFKGKVAALVTLGSPHHGSELAIIGMGPMARSLYPGRGIDSILEDTPDVDAPRLAIYTLFDDYVFPLSCLKIGRDGWQEQVCGPMSHVNMLYSQDISWRVAAFLDAALKE